LKTFQLFIIRPATSPVKPNQTFLLMAHARILFCSDLVRSAAYFPEWKYFLTNIQAGVGGQSAVFRLIFDLGKKSNFP
jgi:hypothetical protein